MGKKFNRLGTGIPLNGFLRPRKGVPVPSNKEHTERKEVVTAPHVRELIFPMKMHTGEPAEPAVDVGDSVRIGTLIGEARGHVSAGVHSSVSGIVTAIEERESFRGLSLSFVIENDGRDEEERFEPLDESISVDTFFARLRESGITGEGGAGFPTHVKFSPPGEGHGYLLINGAECESYSTSDHRVMLEHAPEILRTVDFLRRLFETDHNVVAVEKDMPDVIAVLKRTADDLDYRHITIEKVSDRYPQGDQGVLLRTVFGLELPFGTFPNEMGVLTSNVSTIKAIHDAVFLGRPLVERVVTVTGSAITNPQNVLTRIGTPLRELIDFCGGFKTGVGKLINGGPMMGAPFNDLEIPVAKDTTTILCLDESAARTPDERPCIRCARCIDVCPVNLQPIAISNAYRAGRFDVLEALKAESCILCGSCTYICPSRIPLLEDIKHAIKESES
ncbi:MAG: electron transport complex subunit RsxC [Alkalispirochaeta sp.]